MKRLLAALLLACLRLLFAALTLVLIFALLCSAAFALRVLTLLLRLLATRALLVAAIVLLTARGFLTCGSYRCRSRRRRSNAVAAEKTEQLGQEATLRCRRSGYGRWSRRALLLRYRSGSRRSN